MQTSTFGVLGPVEVRAPGRPPLALPPSVRALLARLALSPGRVVSVDALTDALWGEDLPSDAPNAVQIRVSKLRRALVAAGLPAGVLVTRAPGYQLAVDPEAVDAHRFERLLARARRESTANDPSAALATLDEALALWRGAALADVGDAEWADAESTRLDELRLAALEDRLELLLDLGRHAEAVADLERLATLHPLRERLHRLLLLALYRAGRQADALGVYHRLRRRLADELGVDPAPDLQALAEAILRQQVPATPPRADAPSPGAATTPRRATRTPVLPAPTSPVIGRGDEVDIVLDLLTGHRLVTLIGPGGVGKTTLALEVARHVDPAVAGEVRLVRLAPVEAAADVAEAVAQQLGLLPSGPGEAAVAAVLAFLAERRTLLVLDNCEHVVDSAAALLERVLPACPHVTVLATSREAFALPGEVQVAVQPLAVPGEGDDLAAIERAPAVQLFVERARAVRPAFALDAGTAPIVALICRQLDGVPLAVELAAARVKALPVQEIADRLADRFTFLTAGPRSGEARHRTLRATLDWSHDLLSGTERALLRRLAVFRGGWTLDAAEQVCAGAGIEPADVVDLLFRLVDRSLVVPDPDTGRFRLLVTVRDYAMAKLREAGEQDVVRNRHLEHFTAYAQDSSSLTRWGGAGWARMRAEHDNLRAALEHAIGRARRSQEPGDVDAGFVLANAMVWFWHYNLRYEGVEALSTLLALPGGSPACRALALQGIALFFVYYPTPQSRAAARESLAMLEELGDVRQAALSKLIIAWEAAYGVDVAAARALAAEAAAVLAHDESPGMRAQLHYVQALLDLGEGAFESSITEWHRALVEYRRSEDRIIESAVEAHLGIALRELGRRDEALAALRLAVDLVPPGESMHGLAFALVHLAHTILDGHDDVSGDTSEEVRGLLDHADDVATRAQNPRCQAWAAWGRGRLALAAGDAAAAVDECRRAVALLQDREFPWARAQLWTFLAGSADASGQGPIAEQARDQARRVELTGRATGR
jgi:predicted ATPase/DNA-binding SARP family transcriptional activator